MSFPIDLNLAISHDSLDQNHPKMKQSILVYCESMNNIYLLSSFHNIRETIEQFCPSLTMMRGTLENYTDGREH
jgi:hypothetical protein